MKIKNIIGKSFELWIANPIITLPFVLQLLFNIILAVPYAIFLFYPNYSNLVNLNTEEITRLMIERISGSYSALGWFILLAIALIFVSCFLITGSIGIANEICKGKKAKLNHITEYGKKFWLRYLETSIFIGLIMIFALIVSIPVFLAISLLGLGKTVITVLTVIFAVFVALFSVMFIPATILIIVQDIEPIKAIKISFRLSKKNYCSLLALILILVIINIFINYIPYIGELAGFLIMNPIQTIALILFVTSRIPKLNERKK